MNSISGNTRNVRTYLDCIEVIQGPINGSNTEPISGITIRIAKPFMCCTVQTIVCLGKQIIWEKHLLFFLPGEGTFEIEFDGKKLIWSLTTYNTTQKSSVSSEATSDSGKCDAKGVDTDAQTDYEVNPTFTLDGNVTVKRNISESGRIDLFSNYGVLLETKEFSKSNTNNILFNISGPSGLYYLRITTADKIYMFNIIKN